MAVLTFSIVLPDWLAKSPRKPEWRACGSSCGRSALRSVEKTCLTRLLKVESDLRTFSGASSSGIVAAMLAVVMDSLHALIH